MSRIGNNPVNIPEGVSVSFDGNVINVKGKLGEMSQDINPSISIDIKDDLISLALRSRVLLVITLSLIIPISIGLY